MSWFAAFNALAVVHTSNSIVPLRTKFSALQHLWTHAVLSRLILHFSMHNVRTAVLSRCSTSWVTEVNILKDSQHLSVWVVFLVLLFLLQKDVKKNKKKKQQICQPPTYPNTRENNTFTVICFALETPICI